ncbi:hypothetical protein ACWERY_16370 [Streptomyces sp. NPDC004082]
MNVTRLHDATGSHIEPGFDQTWSEETKLRWHAAVVAHDTGLVIEVHPHPGTRRTSYGINIGEINKGGLTSISAGPYQEAWLALSNISHGAEAVIARVRQVHYPVEYRGRTICAACSSFYGGSCDNDPCLIGECRTLKVVGAGEAP